MAMAHNQAPAFFFTAALLLLAAAAPPAHAKLLSPLAPIQLNVSGLLTCPGSGVPIPGVNVSLICATPGLGSGSGSINLGTTITNPSGQFTISPNLSQLLAFLQTTVTGILGTGLPCVASTQLPIGPLVCGALSTVNGTLVTLLRPLAPILTGNILNITGAVNILIPRVIGG